MSTAPVAGALDQHSPGLDGMRAIGMTVVLVYHAQLGMSGAFLALSQFFTLSGFLITSILLRSWSRTGRIDLPAFWVRRYRRLLPGSFLGIGVVVLFGATVATEQQVADLPGALVAALAHVTNWFFVVNDQSYVALFSAPSPLQHFWSLAVEEQFYVLMPLAVVLILRRARSIRPLGIVFGAGTVASVVLTVVLLERGATIDRLYYGSDTRAAEMLVGCLLAVVLHVRPLRLGERGQRALAGAAVVAFALTTWAFWSLHLTDEVMYRGGLLAFTLLTVTLMLNLLTGRGPVAALFGWAPLAAMGRITYGIYIFHWPIYLWLDEERTGLERWPLFALRVSVTLAVAVLSYHFVEMPIRRGAWPAAPQRIRWALATAVVAVLAGVVFVGQRDVETDLAGLGEPVAAAPISTARGEGVLDVVVVTDAVGERMTDELARLADERDDLAVTRAEPFACAGLDDDPPGACTNWEAEWPALVAEVDPDVVLFNVTRWAPDEIAALSGEDGFDAQSAWVHAVLGAGFDLLTANGARVVWVQFPDVPTQLRQEHEPFFQTMRRLTSERRELQRLPFFSAPVEVVLDGLEANRRQEPGAATRVMVVGDSTSRTLGYGLEHWAAGRDDVVVWSAGTEGCGLADEGVVFEMDGREGEIADECRAAVAAYPEQIATFDPDVVIVMSGVADLQSRRLDGGSEFLRPGDVTLGEYLLAEYTAAADALSVGGATIVWLNVPCAQVNVGPLTELDDRGPIAADRVAYMNSVLLPLLAEARPQVRLFDTFSALCPDGRYERDLDGVENVRPDGIHFGPEGAIWFAERYGDAILELAAPG